MAGCRVEQPAHTRARCASGSCACACPEQVREQALKQERMGDREETYAAIRKTLALLNDPFTRFLVRCHHTAKSIAEVHCYLSER